MITRVCRIAVLLTCFAPFAISQDSRPPGGPEPQTAGSQQRQQGQKDDVSSIGNRKIGSKGIGNWYSLEREISLGREYAQEVEASARLLDDPVVGEYVNRIGQNLARNSDAKVPFVIKIIDSDEVNAFALPGGFMYVNTGAILAAREEAELAGIMAHEIAHVAARHATRQMTRSNLMSFASLPLIFVGGGVGAALRQLFVVAGPLSTMKFSRSFESEADYLGLQYLYKAGYDPQSFVSFFERIEARENKKPGKMTTLMSTHPQVSTRLRKIQEETSSILPPRDLYIVTTSDFDDAQARIHTHLTRRTMHAEETRIPTLRRTTSSIPGDPQPQAEEEPPVLRRNGK